MKKKLKLKRKIKLLGLFLILSVVAVIAFIGIRNYLIEQENIRIENELVAEAKRIEDARLAKIEEDYQSCMSDSSQNVTSDESQDLIDELTAYLKKYSISVAYYNLDYEFEYNYSVSTSYYGASLIKLVDAMYLYENAVNGNIDLDETISYTSSYKLAYSTGMDQHSYGDEVSLRDLVKYALTYSDNTAHNMLYTYIGYTNLKDYARSIGLTTVLNYQDKFGEFTASDAITLLKYVKDFIENNEIGQEILDAMDNDYYKSIVLEGYTTEHKYGLYNSYYHDIGYVETENPFAIAILSLLGTSDYETIFANVTEKVNTINESLVTDKESSCKIYSEGLNPA